MIDVYFREEQALPATVFLAEEQPGARGRGGRAWKAPEGPRNLPDLRARDSGGGAAVGRPDRGRALDPRSSQGRQRDRSRAQVAQRPLRRPSQARRRARGSAYPGGRRVPGRGYRHQPARAGRERRRPRRHHGGTGDRPCAARLRRHSGSARPSRPRAGAPPLGAGGRGVGTRVPAPPRRSDARSPGRERAHRPVRRARSLRVPATEDLFGGGRGRRQESSTSGDGEVVVSAPRRGRRQHQYGPRASSRAARSRSTGG